MKYIVNMLWRDDGEVELYGVYDTIEEVCKELEKGMLHSVAYSVSIEPMRKKTFTIAQREEHTAYYEVNAYSEGEAMSLVETAGLEPVRTEFNGVLGPVYYHSEHDLE